MGIKVVVTGGRNYQNKRHVWGVLKEIHESVGIDTLIHGDCPTGADNLAEQWARKRLVATIRCPAEWGKYGKSAGPKRNQLMADLRPDLCVSFPGNAGTLDMTSRARANEIKVRDERNQVFSL